MLDDSIHEIKRASHQFDSTHNEEAGEPFSHPEYYLIVN